MLCPICGKEFEPAHYNQKLCSDECRKEARKISRDKYKHSEKGKEAEKRWHESERFKENEKRYRQNPTAKHKAVLRSEKYIKSHPEAQEKKRERDREYGSSEKGRKVNNIAQRKYKKTSKGKAQSKKQKFVRRAAGKVDTKYIESLMSGNFCYYCGKEIKGKKTIDHKIPVSRGGTNENENLVLACVRCNTQKGNKTEREYMDWLNKMKGYLPLKNEVILYGK